jgi:hypothetical protein
MSIIIIKGSRIQGPFDVAQGRELVERVKGSSKEAAHSGNGPYSLGWWFCRVRSLNEPISTFFARYARSVPPLRGGFLVSKFRVLYSTVQNDQTD